ncbi:hypothetical protein [Streptomyces coffeae]|uniref:Uncharacterized protein n=1 Tax=Streptomyces coffeae TaxID=621382 RepID=A0ABS1NP09_9ACTN|nr:hypothetical protein [Streptomyces coffeae]MBL1101822.1 hypothetical protein [Streptomyces coffeae]
MTLFGVTLLPESQHVVEHMPQPTHLSPHLLGCIKVEAVIRLDELAVRQLRLLFQAPIC